MDSIIIKSSTIYVFPEYGLFLLKLKDSNWCKLVDSLFRNIYGFLYNDFKIKNINISRNLNGYLLQTNDTFMMLNIDRNLIDFYKQLYEREIQTYDFIVEDNKMTKCPNIKSILKQLDSNLIHVYLIVSNMAVKDVSNIIFANLVSLLYYDKSKFRLQIDFKPADKFDL